VITGLCAYCLKQKLNLTVKDGWEMKYFYDRPADLRFKLLAFDPKTELFIGLDPDKHAWAFPADEFRFMLIEEPLEIWVNYYITHTSDRSFHDSLGSAEQSARLDSKFIQTVKFREVKNG